MGVGAHDGLPDRKSLSLRAKFISYLLLPLLTMRPLHLCVQSISFRAVLRRGAGECSAGEQRINLLLKLTYIHPRIQYKSKHAWPLDAEQYEADIKVKYDSPREPGT